MTPVNHQPIGSYKPSQIEDKGKIANKNIVCRFVHSIASTVSKVASFAFNLFTCNLFAKSATPKKETAKEEETIIFINKKDAKLKKVSFELEDPENIVNLPLYTEVTDPKEIAKLAENIDKVK